MTVKRNFGIDTRNDSGDMLIRFAERNNLMIINTFFYHKASKKLT